MNTHLINEFSRSVIPAAFLLSPSDEGGGPLAVEGENKIKLITIFSPSVTA